QRTNELWDAQQITSVDVQQHTEQRIRGRGRGPLALPACRHHGLLARRGLRGAAARGVAGRGAAPPRQRPLPLPAGAASPPPGLGQRLAAWSAGRGPASWGGAGRGGGVPLPRTAPDTASCFSALSQSDDLKERKEPHVSALRKVLLDEFRPWLSAVTQIELEPTIDLSCAKYEYTDVLLCHDDELEGRRIAFILYLVPPWEKSDGGTLDLYSADEHVQPLQVVKSLVPSWNSLVFFEVSPVSFHQVSEVLSKEKCRLSVSGWFHGPPVARPPRYTEAPLPRSPHVPYDHEILYNWINPVYLDMASQAQIQEEFEDRSETFLKDFFKREKFQLVCEALEKEDIKWTRRGPPNKRCYEVAEEGSLPDILKNCLEFFRSEALFLLLSNFTGLKLHFLASSDEEGEEGRAADSAGHDSSRAKEGETSGNADQRGQLENFLKTAEGEPQNSSSVPTCVGELRQWMNGCYTLVHDTQATEFALDLMFFCGCEDWDAEYGGFTSYIAKGEDEEHLGNYFGTAQEKELQCLCLLVKNHFSLEV
uniref:Prolyl 3-hydroxylase OGFOD1 n=1 Tax=Crocodylus porosus TaxID=8502 RepID=A0A7M4E305_CROPO